MDQKTRHSLVNELTALLEQGNAHVTFDAATADVPAALLNKPVEGLPYTLWQLVEHVRIAQLDILEFSLGPEYKELQWPDDYWPAPTDQADEQRWQAALAQIRQDRTRFLELLRDPEQDLFKPLPHGSGQTLLREALLIGDHTSYHTGQIILLRRQLGNWGE